MELNKKNEKTESTEILVDFLVSKPLSYVESEIVSKCREVYSDSKIKGKIVLKLIANQMPDPFQFGMLKEKLRNNFPVHGVEVRIEN